MTAQLGQSDGERWKRLGDMLLDAGLITSGQLAESLAEKERSKCFLGQALVKLGYLSQDELISFLVKQCKIPHINLNDYAIDPQIVRTLPNDLCLRYKLIAIDQLGKILTVCMVNPLDIDALEHARDACPALKIKPILCTPEHFESVAKRFLVHRDEPSEDAAPKAPDMSLASLGLSSTAPVVASVVSRPSAPGAPETPIETAAVSQETFSAIVRDVLGELLNTFQGPVQGQPESAEQIWSSTESQSAQFSFTLDLGGELCYVSPSVTGIMGYPAQEFQQQFVHLFTDHPANSKLRQAIRLSLSGHQRSPIEAEFFAKDGSMRTLMIALIPVFDGTKKLVAVQGVARDVTRRAATEQSLYYAATHDTLTGLLNRRSFITRLEEAIQHARRYGTPVSIAIVDIDDFTQINETYGHQEGDAILRHVGQTLKQSLRSEDIVAHSGGDEFCILMPQVEPEQAQNGIRRYVDAITQASFSTSGGEALSLAVTAGFSTVAEGAEQYEMLLETARSLVRRGKEAGGNRVVVGEESPAAET